MKLRQKTYKRLEVVWLDPDLLQVDSTYQRPFRQPWGDEIVENFDADQVRPLDVVQRSDGVIAVENGQHTLYALKTKGWQSVPCFVRNGPTSVVQEAQHFIKGNSNSKALRPLEMFDAAVTAEHPVALDIKRIVEFFGLRVAHGVKNGVSAYKALEKTYSLSGPEGLRDVLEIIVSVWDEDDRQRLGAHTINGLAMFLRSQPNVDKARLIARLKTVDPETLHRRARTIVQGAGSNSMAAAVAPVIDSIYRKRAAAKA